MRLSEPIENSAVKIKTACFTLAEKQKTPKERNDPLGLVNLESVLADPSLVPINRYSLSSDYNFAINLYIDVNFLIRLNASVGGVAAEHGRKFFYAGRGVFIAYSGSKGKVWVRGV